MVIDLLLSSNSLSFQVSDSSAVETRTEFEGQKKLIYELQNRLADAEFKLVEGEMLRKKLHNTILVMFLSHNLSIDGKYLYVTKESYVIGAKREHSSILQSATFFARWWC